MQVHYVGENRNIKNISDSGGKHKNPDPNLPMVAFTGDALGHVEVENDNRCSIQNITINDASSKFVEDLTSSVKDVKTSNKYLEARKALNSLAH